MKKATKTNKSTAKSTKATVKPAKGKKVAKVKAVAKKVTKAKPAAKKAASKPEAVKPTGKAMILLAQGSDGSQFLGGIYDAKRGLFWTTKDHVTGKQSGDVPPIPLDVKNPQSNLRGVRFSNGVYCVNRDQRLKLDVMSQAEASKRAKIKLPVIMRNDAKTIMTTGDGPQHYTAAIIDGVPAWAEFRKLGNRNVNHYAVTA